jgi:XRE family transcriptional regulator, regulator of sulfur utilization
MRVKRLRETKGLTQMALAKRAKLHRVYVAQIEARTKVPSLAALERLAKALGVPVTRLLE